MTAALKPRKQTARISVCVSLAPPQGGLHTLAPVSFIVVDEREGQGDVEGVGPARRRRPFPCLERNGEVHPGCRPLGFEALDEVLAKDLAQHGFKGEVYPDGPVWAAWKEKESVCKTPRAAGCFCLARSFWKMRVPEAL